MGSLTQQPDNPIANETFLAPPPPNHSAFGRRRRAGAPAPPEVYCKLSQQVLVLGQNPSFIEAFSAVFRWFCCDLRRFGLGNELRQRAEARATRFRQLAQPAAEAGATFRWARAEPREAVQRCAAPHSPRQREPPLRPANLGAARNRFGGACKPGRECS